MNVRAYAGAIATLSACSKIADLSQLREELRNIIDTISELLIDHIESSKYNRGDDRREQKYPAHAMLVRSARWRSERHIILIPLRPKADRQHGEQREPPKNKIDRHSGCDWHLDLLQFNQRAGEILRMKEQYGPAMRADFWLAITKDAHTLLF